MPLATKTVPTTVGIVEKKPPLAVPLMITKTTNGAMDVETGHRMSMLRALRGRDINRVFNGPKKSLQNPQTNLPSAEEKLNAATSAAPVLDAMPIESVYSGRKNGGTKSGTVARAPVRKSRTKRRSRRRRLQIY